MAKALVSGDGRTRRTRPVPDRRRRSVGSARPPVPAFPYERRQHPQTGAVGEHPLGDESGFGSRGAMFVSIAEAVFQANCIPAALARASTDSRRAATPAGHEACRGRRLRPGDKRELHRWRNNSDACSKLEAPTSGSGNQASWILGTDGDCRVRPRRSSRQSSSIGGPRGDGSAPRWRGHDLCGRCVRAVDVLCGSPPFQSSTPPRDNEQRSARGRRRVCRRPTEHRARGI